MRDKLFNIFFLILVFFCCLVLTASLLINASKKDPEYFSSLVNGYNHKPFAYRALLPFCARNIIRITPENFKLMIFNFSSNIDFSTFINNAEAGKFPQTILADYYLSFYIIFCAVFLFFITYLIFFNKLLNSAITGLNPKITYSASFLTLAALPPFFKDFAYIYDIPALAFFTMMYYFLYNRKWILFYIFFILSTFNKETSILITVIFIFYFSHNLPKKKLLYHMSGIAFLFLIIKILLYFIFLNNPGVSAENHLFSNLSFLIFLPYDFSTFASILFIALLTSYDWKNKSFFFKQSALILIPLSLLTLFFGVLKEIRVFYEILPIFFILILDSVFTILKIPFQRGKI